MNLIGLAELAELYSVSKNTANTWSRQRDWPTPVATLKMGPVWDRDVVLAHKPIANHSQNHVVACAWCGCDRFSEISSRASVPTRIYELTCGHCGQVSEARTVVSNYPETTGLSTSVTKKKEDA